MSMMGPGFVGADSSQGNAAPRDGWWARYAKKAAIEIELDGQREKDEFSQLATENSANKWKRNVANSKEKEEAARREAPQRRASVSPRGLIGGLHETVAEADETSDGQGLASESDDPLGASGPLVSFEGVARRPGSGQSPTHFDSAALGAAGVDADGQPVTVYKMGEDPE